MIDRELAALYGVKTKYLNRQVRRNIGRFPGEFMFQLNKAETKELVTIWHQFNSIKHSHVLPYAFTEHGVAMLASILRTERAVAISIVIVKTFVKLRQILSINKELAAKLEELERRVGGHDVKIQAIFEAIKRLTMPLEPEKKKRKIGFSTEKS